MKKGADNDQLTWTGNPGQSCVWPYSCSGPSRTSYVANETTWTNAGATYTSYWSSFIGSGTIYLSITVGSNDYYATYTLI